MPLGLRPRGILYLLGTLCPIEHSRSLSNPYIIFSHCQTVSMATARFRRPKTEEEEISLLSETVPKNTTYNTKWAVNVFTAWQSTRMNKKAQLETAGHNGLESGNAGGPVSPTRAHVRKQFKLLALQIHL